MPSSFPTSRDALTNPTASDPKNSATVPHASQHANANDAIEAIEAALPITSEGSVPRGVRGYAQVTADQTGITSEVDLTGLSVTVTIGTSRRIRIRGWSGASSSTVAGDVIQLAIKEGTTQLTRGVQHVLASVSQSLGAEVILTPTAGSHTYKLAAARAGGTGTMTWGASAVVPAFIIVEDLGAA